MALLNNEGLEATDGSNVMTRTDNTEDDSDVDRRTFVAGVSAVGVAGVAGCLDGDDGGGTPTTTDEPDGESTPTNTPTATPTPTKTPVDPQFESIPSELSYEFYEGSFDEMPAFDEQSPTGTGKPDLITADPADGAGAVRYTGVLPVGDVLPSGLYEFHADQNLLSEGRLVVYLNGNELNLSGGVSSLHLSGRMDIAVEYYQNSGDGEISLGLRGSFGELLPRIADTDPIRESRWDGKHYEIEARRYPNSKRMQMPQSGSENSKRSLAVGLPNVRNFCFDANTAAVRYGWIGAFLDYGPMVAYGGGRGDDPGQPLGEQFDVGGLPEDGAPAEYPLRIAYPDAEPEVTFKGYRESPHPPKLFYAIDGTDITQRVRGVTDGIGLEYTFVFDEPIAQTVYFHTVEDAPIERDSDVGSWNGGTLEVSEQVEEFTVTITDTEVGE